MTMDNENLELGGEMILKMRLFYLPCIQLRPQPAFAKAASGRRDYPSGSLFSKKPNE